jgi:hypothetical protein
MVRRSQGWTQYFFGSVVAIGREVGGVNLRLAYRILMVDPPATAGGTEIDPTEISELRLFPSPQKKVHRAG